MKEVFMTYQEGDIPVSAILPGLKGAAFERTMRSGTPDVPMPTVETAVTLFVPPPPFIQPVTLATPGDPEDFAVAASAEPAYVPMTITRETTPPAETPPLLATTPNGIWYINQTS